jgi:hypothetical protein
VPLAEHRAYATQRQAYEGGRVAQRAHPAAVRAKAWQKRSAVQTRALSNEAVDGRRKRQAANAALR